MIFRGQTESLNDQLRSGRVVGDSRLRARGRADVDIKSLADCLFVIADIDNTEDERGYSIAKSLNPSRSKRSCLVTQ